MARHPGLHHARRGTRAPHLPGAVGAALCVLALTVGFVAGARAAPAAVAAAPPAGTLIPNTAQGSGVFTGVPLAQNSNSVLAIVQALEACSLTRDTSAVLVP